MRLRFGACALDLATRDLRRDGARVELTPKAYELLALLLQERPRALSKAEIRDRLWPQTFVADVTLVTLAFDVRKAIGDDARRPRHLRTVRSYGYAFVGEVAIEGETASAEPLCRLLLDQREFLLAAGEYVLGRGSDVDIVLDRPKVSRRHARIRVATDGCVLEDLGSKNGTHLRGHRIGESEPLQDGDDIRLGSVHLIFRCGLRTAATKTDPSGA